MARDWFLRYEQPNLILLRRYYFRNPYNKLDIKNIRDFRKHISKKGYSFCAGDFKEFYNLLDSAGIEIFQDKLDKDEFILLMEKYKLLPNDALIVATCKHHEINKIATFDSDFERVDFLEII